MNKTFTVTWIAIRTVAAPCPDVNIDPYTGETTATRCLVAHTKQIESEMSKVFTSKDAADAFVSAAPSECSNFQIYENK